MIEYFTAFILSPLLLSRVRKKVLPDILKALPLSSKYLGPPKALLSAKELQEKNDRDLLSFYPYKDAYDFRYKPFPIDLGKTQSFQKMQDSCHFISSYLFELRNARIFGGNGVVIHSSDKVMKETAIEWVVDPKEHSIFRKCKLPPLQKFKGRIAVLASKSSACYYHWMFEILPRLEILKASKAPYDKIYLNPLVHPFQKSTFDLLGIPEDKVIWSDPKTHIEAESVIVPTLPADPARVPKWAALFTRNLCLDYATLPKGLDKSQKIKLYITRKYAGSRKIVNEDLLQKKLEAKGFSTVALEKLPFLEQVALFKHATVIIAQHGSALANLIFCRENCKVIEIFTEDYLNPCFWILGQYMSCNHHAVLGDSKNISQKDKQEHNIKVDIEALEKLL